MKYLLFIPLLIFLACGESHENKNSVNENSNHNKKEITIMPPLPADSISWLAHNVTSVLIDLYNYDATLSLNKKQGASRAAYFISPDPVITDVSDCKPFAAIIYTGQNGVIYETEIFMNGECSFIRFRKNKEIIHHNKITIEAFEFFNTVLEKAQPPVDS